MITQVAGRAGRGEIPGEVIIQTRMPDNPLLQLALKHDFETFYADEIKSRTLFGFPPTAHLVKLTFQGEELRMATSVTPGKWSPLAIICVPIKTSAPDFDTCYASIE